MSSFPATIFPYAETHYKFKLPWSPLFKRWPEIFLDGPSFCVPGVKPIFYLVIKDADFFPVTVRSLEINLQSVEGQSRQQTIPFENHVDANLVFLPLAIDFTGLSGAVTLNAKITVEDERGRRHIFLNDAFPGLAPFPLRIHLLAEGLPYPPDWHAGELHCHSDYSNDPVEFGASLKVLQEAGQSLGLGYVVCTDHSYDFYYNRKRYMERVDPDANFQAYRKEAMDLNAGAGANIPILIPGEEVSCGNTRGENVHLLVAGYSEFLPGLGDGGRRWLNNKPDLKIGEVLEKLGDTPCFAAHPRVKVGKLERFIFRRGMWDSADLYPSGSSRGVNGLQFWNGTRNGDYRDGKQFWVQQLLAGNRLSPIGANDAHGDLNRSIGVKTPLVSLYQNRNHLFGHVRTVVKSKDKSILGIQAALRSRDLFCTDGPYLHLELDQSKVKIHARSNVDYGDLNKVTLLAGRRGESQETVLKEWIFEKSGPMESVETLEYPIGATYVRAEVLTRGKRFALSSPLYRD